MKNLSFNEVIKLRYSCRKFLSKVVTDTTLHSVLEEAQFSPSNCNTQPWSVHIVSGQKQKELAEKLIAAHKSGQYSPDFTFDTKEFKGIYNERQFAQGKVYYENLGIEREDKEARDEANVKNHNFYNAPHVALLFMPSVGDNVRVAADIGMYAQTFLLSLTAHGLAGVPQTILGFFADTIREHLNISSEYKLLFGISFGYEDVDAKENSVKMKRSPITENVVFH